jgi:hypothetical protein
MRLEVLYSSKAVSILSKTPPWLSNLKKESFEAVQAIGSECLESLECFAMKI